MSEAFFKVTSSCHVHFNQCIDIYTNSFPPGERQPVERIVDRVNSNKCELYCLIRDDAPIGISILWNFSGCTIMFLDYLAIAPSHRGKGFGRLFLSQLSTLASTTKKTLGLEIEHPEYGINTSERLSRMRFYTSSGAKILTNVPYSMPALDGTDDIEMLLLIMDYNKGLPDRDELRKFISKLYLDVYLLQQDHYLLEKTLRTIPKNIKTSQVL